MGIKTILKQDNKFTPFIFIFIFFIIGILSLVFIAINDILLIILSILFFLFCCFFSYEDCLCCLLVLFSFAIIDFNNYRITLFNFLSSIFVLVFIIRYIIDLILKKEKIYKLPFIATSLLILYGLYNLDFSEIVYYFAEVVLILLFYLTFCNSNKINREKLIYYFIIGIISASIISLIYIGFTGKKELFFGLENRFHALYRNPNTLQICCSIAISLLLYLFFKNKIKAFIFYPLSCILIVFGFLTQSKAFLFCLTILLIMYFILEFKENKRLAFILLFCFFIFLIFFVIIFREKIIEYLERFNSLNYDNILDKILTGRYTLWKNYLSLWSSSFVSILFGYGVTYKQPFNLGAHSGYVDTLFTYGLLGCSIIFFLIIVYLNEVGDKKRRFSFVNSIPLIIFLILSLEEYLFSSCRIIFLLTMIILFDEKSSKTNDIVKVEKEEKKKRILFYNGTLLKGGTETYLLSIIQNIDKRKYVFDVLIKNSINMDSKNLSLLKDNGCDIYFYENHNMSLFSLIKFFKDKANKYDIIHINATSKSVGIISFLAKKVANIKKVIFHSHMGGTDSNNIMRDMIGDFMIKKYSDLFVSCSQMAANYMYGKKFIKKNEVKILNNFVDIDKFDYNLKKRKSLLQTYKFINKNTFVILHIGRFAKQKNHEYLIKVFNKILEKNTNSLLILVGEGELKNDIIKQVNELKIDKNVLFLGSRDDISELMQVSDCFVMTSFHEGLPIVAVEAQASGLPCVLSNRISIETKIIESVNFIDISDDSLLEWEKQILQYKNFKRESTKSIIIKKGFSKEFAIKMVEAIYDN